MELLQSKKRKYPETSVVTTSTAGNILGAELKDRTLIATCISFEKTDVAIQAFETGKGKSEKIGFLIANSYKQEDLALLFLLSTSDINAENFIIKADEDHLTNVVYNLIDNILLVLPLIMNPIL